MYFQGGGFYVNNGLILCKRICRRSNGGNNMLKVDGDFHAYWAILHFPKQVYFGWFPTHHWLVQIVDAEVCQQYSDGVVEEHLQVS
jgi:hypothetical protein